MTRAWQHFDNVNTGPLNEGDLDKAPRSNRSFASVAAQTKWSTLLQFTVKSVALPKYVADAVSPGILLYCSCVQKTQCIMNVEDDMARSEYR